METKYKLKEEAKKFAVHELKNKKIDLEWWLDSGWNRDALEEVEVEEKILYSGPGYVLVCKKSEKIITPEELKLMSDAINGKLFNIETINEYYNWTIKNQSVVMDFSFENFLKGHND